MWALSSPINTMISFSKKWKPRTVSPGKIFNEVNYTLLSGSNLHTVRTSLQGPSVRYWVLSHSLHALSYNFGSSLLLVTCSTNKSDQSIPVYQSTSPRSVALSTHPPLHDVTVPRSSCQGSALINVRVMIRCGRGVGQGKPGA